MRGLVGDLLDAGRIESGTLSVAPEATPVAALVERARNAFVAGGGRDANRVRIFVMQLRDKLGDRADAPQRIFNLRGVG